MGQTSIDRLRDFLAQLSPQSQALLMREYERAIERKEDVRVASYVLDELRKIIRSSADAVRPRVEDPTRLVFRFIEPFLVEGSGPIRPGQIRRASLLPIWLWLEREGAPDLVRAFEADLAALPGGGAPTDVERVVKKFQLGAAEAITALTGPNARGLPKINPPFALDDLPILGALLKAREALDGFSVRIASFIRVFGDPQIVSATAALSVPAVAAPQVLPFALSILMKRLSASWQVIRLAIRMAGSDDETRVAATPFGITVTMVIHDLAQRTARMREDIKRSRFDNVAEHLRVVHDGIRGLRTELDIRNDSAWGKQLAAVRVEISGALQSEIDNVPGRVRRLLRQRSDRDAQSTPLDPADVAETAALIDFVAVCRTYASELAINEVTMRIYSDLQQYVEKTTESLVQSLRTSEGKVRAFRKTQVEAAIRFCEVLFGNDYASLMGRAADNAMVVVERKPSRAG